MEREQIKQLFARHMEEFQKEVAALKASPEVMASIHEIIGPVLRSGKPAMGLNARLGEYWETLMPEILAMANTEQKKQELLGVAGRMLMEQIKEFNRILTSDFPTS